MKPLHDAARIRRVIVSTYQATSGAGVNGERELRDGTQARLASQPYQYQTFQHSIAFNLIPQIGSPKYEGYTSEEMKMVWETHKIFGDDSIQICPTCVRVPVENCHSESILVETERPLSVAEARELFAATAGIEVVDDLGSSHITPCPRRAAAKTVSTSVASARIFPVPNGLAFWCVSDNLRKGAATNAVQIAEYVGANQQAAH